MSFTHKHQGVPCQTYNCALPFDPPEGEPAVPAEDEELVDLPSFIHSLSQEYDDLTFRRHQQGAEEYGPGKFLQVDTLEEVLEELADLGNYARYTYIKVRLLQEAIKQHAAGVADKGGFVSSKDVTAVREPKK